MAINICGQDVRIHKECKGAALERFRQTFTERAVVLTDSKDIMKKQKFISLNRKGTVNKYKGFIADEGLFELEKGAIEAG